MRENNLNSRVVLVTGASRGIGRALALGFAKEGCRIFVNYHGNETAAQETVEDISKVGGKAEALKADVSDPSAVNNMAETLLDKAGRIDVLVNNAGICRNTTIAQMDESAWDDIVKTDLSGVFYVTRAFSKQLMKQKNGSVINISSISGVKGAHGSGNYAAAKGGLISFTKSAAMELGRFGVCVNAVCPGFHMTDMGKHATERYLEETRKASVLGLTTDMEELVEFILLLSRTKTVSGQVFNIDSRTI